MLTKVSGGRRSRQLFEVLADRRNVLYFMKRVPDPDDTAAFQRAIDNAAFATADSDPMARGADVVVPYRPQGYVVSGLVMRSHVRLIGWGGFVRLRNPARDGTPTIIGDGANEEDGVLRWTTVSNFLLRGNPLSGHGIHYTEHDNNLITHCRITEQGGDAVRGEKGPVGVKSDGLVLDHVYLHSNAGAGLRLGTNSHYCEVRGGSRLANNRGRSIDVSCTAFSVFGGSVSGEAGPALEVARVANCNGGGFWGTSFEGTPATEPGATLLRVGDPVVGAARGLMVSGCNFTASGAPGDVTLLDVATAEGTTVHAGHMDANTAANVTLVRIGVGATGTILDGVNNGPNVGGGTTTPLINNGVGTVIR